MEEGTWIDSITNPRVLGPSTNQETTMKPKFMTMFGFLILLCTALGSSANAQCVFSFNRGGASSTMMKRIAPRTEAAHKGAIAENRIDSTTAGDNQTITGLWDLQFISDNQVVDEGFDQYHSDGTEILNDTPPPAAGNVCLGVWAKTGTLSLKLKHPSWIYDPTNTFVIGTATILEQITLDPSGDSFAGTFTVQLRDLSGNSLGPDLTGQLQASRITPD
jgi:hypothetical protein